MAGQARAADGPGRRCAGRRGVAAPGRGPPRAGSRTARGGAPRRVRWQAPARAVRRHAPAGGPGPGAGAGRRRAAHGRAVRRAGAMTRDLLHDELDRICTERGLTVLFVTHNVREAVRLGDRVVLLSSRPGRVIDEFAVPSPVPGGSTRRRWPSWPGPSPTGCERRWAAMARLSSPPAGLGRQAWPAPWTGDPRAHRARHLETVPLAGGRHPWSARSIGARRLAEAAGGRAGHRRVGDHPPHRVEALRAARPGHGVLQPMGADAARGALAGHRHHHAAARSSASRCRCSSARWPARWCRGSSRCARPPVADHRHAGRCRRSPGSRSPIILFGRQHLGDHLVIVLGSAPSVANGLIRGWTTSRRCCCGPARRWACPGCRCTGT